MEDSKITKTRILKHEFGRMCLDHRSLERIGLKFQECKGEINSEFEMEVSSLDGEEIVTFNNPAIFSDNSSLPKQIGKISFSLKNPANGILIEFKINRYLPKEDPVPWRKYPRLEMTSNNGMHASGIFSEIVKKARNYEIKGKKVIEFTRSFVGLSLLSILSTVLVFLILQKIIPDDFLANSENADVWATVIILFLLVTLMTGGILINYVVKKVMPPVTFVGESSGTAPSTVGRLFGYIIPHIFRSS